MHYTVEILRRAEKTPRDLTDRKLDRRLTNGLPVPVFRTLSFQVSALIPFPFVLWSLKLISPPGEPAARLSLHSSLFASRLT